MKKKFPVFLILIFYFFSSDAQVQLGEKKNSFDYSSPLEYEIGGIVVSGVQLVDESALVSLSGLRVGDKITIPGDKIQGAINNLWKQGLFSDIKISVLRTQGKIVFLEISLSEKPRLSRFSFNGVNKGEADKIRESIHLVNGKPVTENLKKTTSNIVRNYFVDKGFMNTEVTIKEKPDTLLPNSVMLIIDVYRKQKVKIDRIIFHGNKELGDLQLKRSFKDTKEKNRFEIFSDIKSKLFHKDPATNINVQNTLRSLFSAKAVWHYLSDKVRLAVFSSSRFIPEHYQDDRQQIVQKYAESGYRDAKVTGDTIYKTGKNTINIEINVDEGKKYYFRNISWLGNTKYSTEELNGILGIRKGDVFDQSVLDSRLFMNPNGRDISSLYLDEGYLFFQVTPVEVAVDNDSIDLEMRIYEGRQAIINKVTVAGNTKTNDRVIMREIRTRPGQLFSRSDIIRSQRELAQLGYFNPEKLNVNPKPNPADGTVDIEYIVEEKPSDQLELSGGWSGGQIGFTGALGIVFNNFSTRNIMNKQSWAPLPAGDGQRLSVRIQTNGIYYQSYNASFTEPWFGGKKPNSLSVTTYHSLQSNGVKKSDTTKERSAIEITGVTLGLGKRLKWPDDYFIFSGDLSYQYYILNKYTNFVFSNGYSNNFSSSITIARNSINQPIYPRAGSQVSLSLQLTPPYSLLSGKDYSTMALQQKYKFMEYYKWKAGISWFTKIAGDLVLNTRMKYGFLGYYNSAIGYSPFERFYLGGDGLSGFSLDGREIIALRGYENYGLTPKGYTSTGSYDYVGGTVYDKYTFEFRYPVSLAPQATIYALAFCEAGNAWAKFKEFDPFGVKRSAGVGVRIFLSFIGQLGFDWGYGFDHEPGTPSSEKHRFHFVIGQSIE